MTAQQFYKFIAVSMLLAVGVWSLVTMTWPVFIGLAALTWFIQPSSKPVTQASYEKALREVEEFAAQRRKEASK